MKTLPTAFSKNGFDYEMVKRNTYAAIFAQKLEGGDYAYEVIRIKNRETRHAFGSILEGGEHYPTANNWGTDGFTYHNLELAEVKFQELSIPKPVKAK